LPFLEYGWALQFTKNNSAITGFFFGIGGVFYLIILPVASNAVFLPGAGGVGCVAGCCLRDQAITLSEQIRSFLRLWIVEGGIFVFQNTWRPKNVRCAISWRLFAICGITQSFRKITF
jgi:hypothetical protein